MRWLAEKFNCVPNHATDVVVLIMRVYILHLNCGMFFADNTQNIAHLIYLPLLADFEQDQIVYLEFNMSCLALSITLSRFL